jgi:hypothetical protein
VPGIQAPKMLDHANLAESFSLREIVSAGQVGLSNMGTV